MPKLYAKGERPHHPFIDDYARTVDYDPHFRSAADVKRAIAGYSGLVSSLDENVGDVLRALRESGLEGETRVLYTSDHGDNAGARGLWGKSTFYEESAGVPLIVAGPGVRAGRVVATPVSHIDCAPTILEATGLPDRMGGQPLPGASLFAVAQGATPTRPVISEYHAIGSTAGAFMLRFRQVEILPLRRAIRRSSSTLRPTPRNWSTSPAMRASPTFSPKASGCLRAELDPDEVDARAKRRQQRAARELRRPRSGAGARRPGFHAGARHGARNELTCDPQGATCRCSYYRGRCVSTRRRQKQATSMPVIPTEQQRADLESAGEIGAAAGGRMPPRRSVSSRRRRRCARPTSSKLSIRAPLLRFWCRARRMGACDCAAILAWRNLVGERGDLSVDSVALRNGCATSTGSRCRIRLQEYVASGSSAMSSRITTLIENNELRIACSPGHESCIWYTCAAGLHSSTRPRSEIMVSIWWLIWAFVIGGYAGMLLISLLVLARR